MSNDSQVSRIGHMERCLDDVTKAVKRLNEAIDKYEAVQDVIAALDAYYGSCEWRQDLADDEAGRLPAGLKRGVLSQDGIWNLLTDCRDLNARLQELAKKLSPE